MVCMIKLTYSLTSSIVTLEAYIPVELGISAPNVTATKSGVCSNSK